MSRVQATGVEGQITACGFVTIFLEKLDTSKSVEGQITACGFVTISFGSVKLKMTGLKARLPLAVLLHHVFVISVVDGEVVEGLITACGFVC